MADISKITLPNGNQYDIKDTVARAAAAQACWYGVCSTSASTQAKTVSITGFSSDNLLEGTKITIRFTKGQTYNGTPTLNVSSTGAKNICSSTGEGAVRYEWSGGDVITFVYYNNTWIVVNGAHATDSNYGITRFGSYSSDSSELALSTSELLGFSAKMLYENTWNGVDVDPTIIVNSTTPAASGWTDEGNSGKSVVFNNVTWNIDNNKDNNRIVKITYNESTIYYTLNVYDSYLIDGSASLVLYNFPPSSSTNNAVTTIIYDDSENELTLLLFSNDASDYGAYPFKIEFYECSNPTYVQDSVGAGYITYPVFKDTLSKYLTLEDLPIYDGSVSSGATGATGGTS